MRLPRDLRKLAGEAEILGGGVAAAGAALGLLALTGHFAFIPDQNGRILLPSIMITPCVMVLVSLWLADVAVATLRRKQRRKHLLSTATL